MAVYAGSDGNDIATPSQLSANFLDDDRANGWVSPEKTYPSGERDSFGLGKGNDYADGGGGNDDLNGGENDDTLIGGDDNDAVDGDTGNDQLFGGDGVDIMAASEGIDKAEGGPGDDYYLTNSATIVIENPGAGTDLVFSFEDFSLPSNVENLQLGPEEPGVYVGNGNELANAIAGSIYEDHLYGLDGDDVILADPAGANANDIIDGGLGNDRIYAAAGIDQLFGGPGDDSYLIVPGAKVTEEIDQGRDEVHIDGDYTLPANVEDLSLGGELGAASKGYTGTGNELNNVIVGADLDDMLLGLGGNDTIDGDLLDIQQGQDSIYGGPGNDELHGQGGNDFLSGDSDRDTLHGGGENDVLDGGADNDVLTGEGGADRFQFTTPANTGRDLITDYQRGDGDIIELPLGLKSVVSEEQEQDPPYLWTIHLDGGGMIQLDMVDAGDDGSILNDVMIV